MLTSRTEVEKIRNSRDGVFMCSRQIRDEPRSPIAVWRENGALWVELSDGSLRWFEIPLKEDRGENGQRGDGSDDRAELHTASISIEG